MVALPGMRELPPRQTTGAPRAAHPRQPGVRRPVPVDQAPGKLLRAGALARLCLTVALATPCVGCHAEPAPVTPKHAVDAYTQAVRDKRYDDAYALLSREAKGLVSRGEFERRLERDPEE